MEDPKKTKSNSSGFLYLTLRGSNGSNQKEPSSLKNKEVEETLSNKQVRSSSVGEKGSSKGQRTLSWRNIGYDFRLQLSNLISTATDVDLTKIGFFAEFYKTISVNENIKSSKLSLVKSAALVSFMLILLNDVIMKFSSEKDSADKLRSDFMEILGLTVNTLNGFDSYRKELGKKERKQARGECLEQHIKLLERAVLYIGTTTAKQIEQAIIVNLNKIDEEEVEALANDDKRLKLLLSVTLCLFEHNEVGPEALPIVAITRGEWDSIRASFLHELPQQEKLLERQQHTAIAVEVESKEEEANEENLNLVKTF